MNSVKKLLIFLVVHISAANKEHAIIELCNEQSTKTCEECIRAHEKCVWIYEQKVDGPRCRIFEDSLGTLKYYTGGNSRFEIVKNDVFTTNLKSLGDEPAVQIKPQKVKIFLRKDKSVTFSLKYKATPNYPLDIYYLMDLTYSMRPHKEQLSTLSQSIATKLRELTENYKIAFGYYSDKVASPFVKMDKVHQLNPCHDADFRCEKGYNFRHALNFTDDLDKFTKQVNEGHITANIDDYEGGMDAIMQILVCQEELNWRKHSRKIIILASDGLLHVGGDGKIAGATKRNVHCKLVSDGDYLSYDGLGYDYPSFEEIYRRLVKYKVHALFAVPEDVKEYYKEVQNIMNDVTSVGDLVDSSENILELLEEGYRKLVRRVQFNVMNDNDYLKVSFKSTCNTKKVNETSACEKIVVNTTYVFDVTLELKYLPDKKMDIIQIEEQNLKEIVELEVHYIGAECDCVENSNKKITHGYFKCGKYHCDSGWIGEKCEKQCDIDAGRFKNDTYVSTTCNNRGDFDHETCSCICDSNHMGDHCEYNQCPRDRNWKICSDHGNCVKGECNCYEDYQGDACDCLMTTESCKAPNQDKICSGHGKCKCGKCECFKEDVEYDGQFCEKCKTCDSLCSLYEENVKAIDTPRKMPENVKTRSVEDFNQTEDWRKCRVDFYNAKEQFCVITYTYEILHVEGSQQIYIDYKKECNKIVAASTSIGSTFGAVLITLLLGVIVWKIVTCHKDRREMAKFVEQQKAQQTTMNPLYKDPNSFYRNPQYTPKGKEEETFFS